MTAMPRGIYLDHHAATPPIERARRAMDEAREVAWANPSSVHGAGRASRAILERARDAIARAIGAASADVVLTGGGTEACNLAVLGIAGDTPRHLVTTAIEHPAIAQPIAALEARGWRVTRLAVPRGRAPSPEEVSRAITDDTALLAIQWVNHETGTILPVDAYAAIARARSIPIVIDAIQALGKIPVDVVATGATAIALASHKVGGPAGAGALWITRDAREIAPRLLGGAQERGRRAGSPDVVALAGFGAACDALAERLEAMGSIAIRRDALERAVASHPSIVINADAGPRVSTVISASARGWRGTSLVAALDLEGVQVASGAACSSGVDRPSPVLAAMHEDEPWRASSSLRISLGPATTDDEIEGARGALLRVLARPPA